jgi:hypothetical protein
MMKKKKKLIKKCQYQKKDDLKKIGLFLSIVKLTVKLYEGKTTTTATIYINKLASPIFLIFKND